jgi:hypothetical protein
LERGYGRAKKCEGRKMGGQKNGRAEKWEGRKMGGKKMEPKKGKKLLR